MSFSTDYLNIFYSLKKNTLLFWNYYFPLAKQLSAVDCNHFYFCNQATVVLRGQLNTENEIEAEAFKLLLSNRREKDCKAKS